jgi:hypothetical protein
MKCITLLNLQILNLLEPKIYHNMLIGEARSEPRDHIRIRHKGTSNLFSYFLLHFHLYILLLSSSLFITIHIFILFLFLLFLLLSSPFSPHFLLSPPSPSSWISLLRFLLLIIFVPHLLFLLLLPSLISSSSFPSLYSSLFPLHLLLFSSFTSFMTRTNVPSWFQNGNNRIIGLYLKL